MAALFPRSAQAGWYPLLRPSANVSIMKPTAVILADYPIALWARVQLLSRFIFATGRTSFSAVAKWASATSSYFSILAPIPLPLPDFAPHARINLVPTNVGGISSGRPQPLLLCPLFSNLMTKLQELAFASSSFARRVTVSSCPSPLGSGGGKVSFLIPGYVFTVS